MARAGEHPESFLHACGEPGLKLNTMASGGGLFISEMLQVQLPD